MNPAKDWSRNILAQLTCGSPSKAAFEFLTSSSATHLLPMCRRERDSGSQSAGFSNCGAPFTGFASEPPRIVFKPKSRKMQLFDMLD